MENTLLKLGASFRGARIQSGLTQEDLAGRTGVSVSSIRRLEQGRSIGLDAYLALLQGIGEDASAMAPSSKPVPEGRRATGHKSSRARVMNEIRSLWAQHRDECAWFVRRDFEPKNKAEALFCLSCLEKQGDRNLWIRSKELGKCL
ncbi:MAG: helix-turn-helix domain-containing protein [Kiritimatiellia bacterium]|jgi:transcriptional regulator with XRE-family HTH domain